MDEVRIGQAGDHDLLAEFRLPAFPARARRQDARRRSTCAGCGSIFNGAEPISVELAEEFLARLAPNGLRRAAMLPVYGLAEATLAVTIPAPGAGRFAR